MRRAIVVVALALSASACGSVGTQTSTVSGVTSAPAPIVAGLDGRYLSSIRPDNSFGPRYNEAQDVVDLGHEVCTTLDSGASRTDVTLIVSDGYKTGRFATDAGEIVSSAITYYCPRFQNR